VRGEKERGVGKPKKKTWGEKPTGIPLKPQTAVRKEEAGPAGEGRRPQSKKERGLRQKNALLRAKRLRWQENRAVAGQGGDTEAQRKSGGREGSLGNGRPETKKKKKGIAIDRLVTWWNGEVFEDQKERCEITWPKRGGVLQGSVHDYQKGGGQQHESRS